MKSVTRIRAILRPSFAKLSESAPSSTVITPERTTKNPFWNQQESLLTNPPENSTIRVIRWRVLDNLWNIDV